MPGLHRGLERTGPQHDACNLADLCGWTESR